MTRYAIILSSEEYKDYSDTVYCHADAMTFQETLIGYLDFDISNICMETLYENNSEFSSYCILNKIQQFVDKMNNNDSILFFYAGHGIVHENEAYLILPDTDSTDISSTAIKVEEIDKILSSKTINSIIILASSCGSSSSAFGFK